MWFLLLWALGLIASTIYIWVMNVPHTASDICTALLLGQFVVTFGLLGILGLITNVFIAKTMAAKLNWPGGPFQVKYGFAQLCIGVMGVMCYWFRGNFWAATLVNMYMYSISGLWTHTQEMIENKKIDAMNMSNHVMNLAYQFFITILSILAGGIWITGM